MLKRGHKKGVTQFIRKTTEVLELKHMAFYVVKKIVVVANKVR
jgi:menaquinone-dependent protoporphyrinogen IX oxidase